MKTQYSKVNSFSIQHGDNGSVAVVKTAHGESEGAQFESSCEVEWRVGCFAIAAVS